MRRIKVRWMKREGVGGNGGGRGITREGGGGRKRGKEGSEEGVGGEVNMQVWTIGERWREDGGRG